MYLLSKKAINVFIDHFEFIVGFILVSFLLLMKLLHLAGRDWIDSAILATLMFLAVGLIRDRARQTSFHDEIRYLIRTGRQDAVRWYSKRLDATPDMLRDLERYEHLIFLGISQTSLLGYLTSGLKLPNVRLPWVRIEVYFAPDGLGRLHEQAKFLENIKGVRHDLAFFSTDPEFKPMLPYFVEATALQHRELISYTGSVPERTEETV